MKTKTFLLLTLLLISCLPLTISCAINPGENYIVTNYQFSQDALPDLIRYMEKDATLSDIDKQARIEAIKVWQTLLNDRYLALKGEKK